MAADWWALGVVCFECLTDGLPFPFAEDDATQSPAHVLECIARRVHTYKMAEQLSPAAVAPSRSRTEPEPDPDPEPEPEPEPEA